MRKMLLLYCVFFAGIIYVFFRERDFGIRTAFEKLLSENLVNNKLCIEETAN